MECRSLFDTADYWLRHDVVKWTRFVETTSVWWCHGCVAQPLEPLFTPWVLLEGGRNTKSLKWATYLTYLCFTMTIRSIKNETSTTPSCRGPLRAQIFQNVNNQKCEFWPLLPFLKRPPELVKNENFQKKQFLLFYFVTLSLITKNYVSITKTAAFSS